MHSTTAIGAHLKLNCDIKRELYRAALKMRFSPNCPRRRVITGTRMVIVGIYRECFESIEANRRCQRVGMTNYYVTDRAELCLSVNGVLLRRKGFMDTEADSDLYGVLSELRDMNRA